MDLGERGWGDVGRIHVAQERNQWKDLTNMVLNLLVLQYVEKFLSN
jgi:hypothetical protein